MALNYPSGPVPPIPGQAASSVGILMGLPVTQASVVQGTGGVAPGAPAGVRYVYAAPGQPGAQVFQGGQFGAAPPAPVAAPAPYVPRAAPAQGYTPQARAISTYAPTTYTPPPAPYIPPAPVIPSTYVAPPVPSLATYTPPISAPPVTTPLPPAPPPATTVVQPVPPVPDTFKPPFDAVSYTGDAYAGFGAAQPGYDAAIQAALNPQIALPEQDIFAILTGQQRRLDEYVRQATAGMRSEFEQQLANQVLDLQSRFAQEGSYLSGPMFSAQGQLQANLTSSFLSQLGQMQLAAANAEQQRIYDAATAQYGTEFARNLQQAQIQAETARSLSAQFSAMASQSGSTQAGLLASLFSTEADNLTSQYNAQLDALVRQQGLDLQSALGFGSLQNQQADIALRQMLGTGSLALEQQGLNLQEMLGLGDLETKRLNLALQEAMGFADIGLRSDLGFAGLNLQSDLGFAGLNLQQDLGFADLALRELLGMSNIDLQRELGWGGLDLQRELGLGNLNLGQGQLALQEALGFGNLGLQGYDAMMKYGLLGAQLQQQNQQAALDAFLRQYYAPGTAGYDILKNFLGIQNVSSGGGGLDLLGIGQAGAGASAAIGGSADLWDMIFGSSTPAATPPGYYKV